MIHPDTEAWLAALDAPTTHWRNQLEVAYGSGGPPAASRVLLRDALMAFRSRFGNTATRVFRAPGRVNLRGMHVDTHGGYLNLMSHQREIVVVFAPHAPGQYDVINTNAQHASVQFNTEPFRATLSAVKTWTDFLATAPARAAIESRGSWAHYLLGAALRAEHSAAGAPLMGLRACVAGNIPPGAALSSSAALCVAFYGAVQAMNGRDLSPASWILAARDAEWFSGARTGTSDQAASILCRPREICSVALLAEDFSLETLRRVPFPDDLRLLVINSCTRRSLSGAEQLAYTRNRFAYSMAMAAFRAAWAHGGEDDGPPIDRLSRITAHSEAQRARIYDALARVPASVTLDALRRSLPVPDLEDQYTNYFGHLPADQRPIEFDLQGPLIYGISESERARVFCDLIEQGDYVAAGHSMSVGHDGDRVRIADGTPHHRALPPGMLQAARDANTPIMAISGDYGASSPALDALVDTALSAGALGACLTGAGIAGCVIALCRADDATRIADAARARLASEDYPTLARRDAPITPDALAEALVENLPIGGAGELPWPT